MSKIIQFEEGYRPKAYYCSEQYPTIAIGLKLSHTKNTPLEAYDALEVGEDAALALLEQHLKPIYDYLDGEFSYQLSGTENWNREEILASMCYQLGISGFKKFKKMIAAIKEENWEEAAAQALDSKWAKQTPERAKRHAEVLRTGTLEAYKDLI